jgi:cytoskeleton protein RodZ
MNDSMAPSDSEGQAPSAGAQLRAAREKRGLHIAALAAAMKVPQRKLEALEADRYDALPDLTFTRALAQSVCRTLKIDAQPVLDRLPNPGDMPKLAQVGAGINAPFRERPGREEPTDWNWVRRPVVWGTLLVLAAAAAIAFLPERWFGTGRAAGVSTSTSTSTSSVGALAGPAASVATSVVPDAPSGASEPAFASTAPSPAAPGAAPSTTTTVIAPTAAASGPDRSPLMLRASAASWIEVQDANGQLLMSRNLMAGESTGIDGAMPLRVTIGNAAATLVEFRGRPVDLAPNTRDNVARLQLN